jgi:hypothetical protein
VEVAPLVFIVNTVEQVGVQDGDEKEAVAPEGSPETEKDTGCEAPAVKLGVIELVAEDPAVSEVAPELESAKSKDGAGGAFCL